MIKKIIFALILLCLFIAIPLAVFGIKHVDIGPSFIAFMHQTSRDLEGWKINIPDIPFIPQPEQVSLDGGFLDFLQNLGYAIVSFLNFIVRFFNVCISFINACIQFIQFIFTLLKNLIAFTDTLKRIGTPA